MVTAKSHFYTRYSPLDGSEVGVVEFLDPAAVAGVLATARAAFTSWSQTTIESRGRVIRQAALAIESDREFLAQLVRRETGKPLQVALAEIGGAVEMGFLVASHGRHPSGYVLPSAVPGKHVRVERVPFGVALLIVTYNAPVPNYAWKIFPSLMAGNTVVLKPSPATALSANRFAKIMWAAGVPEDALQVVHGEGDVAGALLEAGPELVSFTGSYNTGQQVAEAAARVLAKTVVELGGSNPLIVCADANLDKAATTAIDSAFSNAGQRCASASRVIIEAGVYEEFRQIFLDKASKLSFGNADDVDVSTLVNAESVRNFEDYLARASEADGVITRLGTFAGNSATGHCVAQPAVIEGLDASQAIAAEEFFGPATRFFPFGSENEALDIANSSPYALTAAVWTEDVSRAERMVRTLNAGVVSINGPTHGAEINMPFGGAKNSGNGTRDAGVFSVDEYSDTRVVSTFFGV